MLIMKNSLKNIKSELCPHCGSKINIVIEAVSDKETSDRKTFDFYSIKEDDWLLP